MRCIAASTLGELRAEYAVEALVALLSDDAPCGLARKVFHSAAEALEKIGTSEALQELDKWHSHL
jgi:HEAT repeat protein